MVWLMNWELSLGVLANSDSSSPLLRYPTSQSRRGWEGGQESDLGALSWSQGHCPRHVISLNLHSTLEGDLQQLEGMRCVRSSEFGYSQRGPLGSLGPPWPIHLSLQGQGCPAHSQPTFGLIGSKNPAGQSKEWAHFLGTGSWEPSSGADANLAVAIRSLPITWT